MGLGIIIKVCPSPRQPKPSCNIHQIMEWSSWSSISCFYSSNTKVLATSTTNEFGGSYMHIVKTVLWGQTAKV